MLTPEELNDEEHGAALQEALNAGVPLAVWLRRRSARVADARAELEKYLLNNAKDPCLCQLPRTVWEYRRKDCTGDLYLGAGLTLLWDDDPERVPPIWLRAGRRRAGRARDDLMSDDWKLFRGTHEPHDAILRLPHAPGWRTFAGGRAGGRPDPKDLRPLPEDSRDARRGRAYRPGPSRLERPEFDRQVELVNAALYLRRPLLVTGKPGTGKSTLAFAVAHELKLGPVLHWPISSRSTLAQGLYHYDAVGRLQEVRVQGKGQRRADIGRFIQLGPLGTALLESSVPRVLLIDEIDKSDIDLPNDLLNIFEEGEFDIPELSRLPDLAPVRISTYYARRRTNEADAPAAAAAGADRDLSWWEVVGGLVRCREFPFVVMTNNGEREFPAPFHRRCLRLELPQPSPAKLAEIVAAHFEDETPAIKDSEREQEVRDRRQELIEAFLKRPDREDLATDQLLNAIYLLTRDPSPDGGAKSTLVDALLRSLSRGGAP